MTVPFGKHKGTPVELLLLKEPDYVYWLFQQHDESASLLRLKEKARSLFKKFDQKPFRLRKCMGGHCSALATGITFYESNLAPYWWCDNCNVKQSGAVPGKLRRISSYSQALSHVKMECDGRRDSFKALITTMAQAKGLPPRAGKLQAAKFFLT